MEKLAEESLETIGRIFEAEFTLLAETAGFSTSILKLRPFFLNLQGDRLFGLSKSGCLGMFTR